MAGKKQQMSIGGALLTVIVIVVVTSLNQRKPGGVSPGAGGGSAPGSSAMSAADQWSDAAAEDRAHGPTAPARREGPSVDRGERTVRIGSWNIEWLGRPDRRSGAAQGVEQGVTDLASYVAYARVEVLALQEIIADTGAGVGPGRTPRSSRLDETFAEVSRSTGAAWDYVLFPGRRDDDQLTGVAWNTRTVTALDARGETWDAKDVPTRLAVREGRSSQGSGLWNRPPHAMRLRLGEGQTDVAMVPVHMKADYDGVFDAHRREEAAGLVGALSGLRERWSERDVIVIGDTNVTSAREAAMLAFAGAGMTDMNADERQTHWRSGSMDRAFVPSDQPEFADAGFEVVSDSYLRERAWQPRDFKRALSDHYMVVVTVRVTRDDD